jgi:hypothetical protein
MRNYKPKADRGLCTWHGCQNRRDRNGGLCDLHTNQIKTTVAVGVRPSRPSTVKHTESRTPEKG